MSHLLQGKAATSRLTLPLTIAYTALVWLAMVSLGITEWHEAALVWLAAILFTALNNREALLPFYSQSISCSFLMLSTLLFATCSSLSAAICALGFSAFLLILLPSYQDRRAPGTVYFAFIMLGVMSVYFIQVLCYLPFLWFVMRSKLMNLGSRSFFASLLGILTPYWFILGYLALTGNIMELPSYFQRTVAFSPLLQYTSLSPWQLATMGMTVILGGVSIIYFLHTSYADKIRTRLLNETFTFLFFVTVVFLALQPGFYEELMAIMVVFVSPLAGRLFALSHTKLSNIFYIASIAICAIYTILALWMSSMSS